MALLLLCMALAAGCSSMHGSWDGGWDGRAVGMLLETESKDFFIHLSYRMFER
uniref:Uncharacterized protein n=1 Tax=Oryza brachyantha TaxID=4533 RepID=J3L6B8_ORYBR